VGDFRKQWFIPYVRDYWPDSPLGRASNEGSLRWPHSYGTPPPQAAGLANLDKFIKRKFPDRYDVLHENLVFLWGQWKKDIQVAETFRQWLEKFTEQDNETGWYARHWRAITPGRISSPQGIEAALARHRTELKEAGAEDPAHEKHQAFKSAVLALEIHPRVVAAYDNRPDRPQPTGSTERSRAAEAAQVLPFPSPAPPEAALGAPGAGEGLFQVTSSPTGTGVPVPVFSASQLPGTQQYVLQNDERGLPFIGRAGETAPRPQPSTAPLMPVRELFAKMPPETVLDRIERKIDELSELLRTFVQVANVTSGQLAYLAEPGKEEFQQWAWPVDWERLYTLADFSEADA